MRARGRGRRPAVLGWIALLLFLSGVARLGGHADMAFAIGTGDGETPADPSTCAAVEGTGALLDAFRARETRLSDREATVTAREEAVALATAEVEEKIAALAEAERSLAEMVALAQSAASDDLARLTAVYENMKPQDAAALFETMDPAFSAGFLGMMQPAAAAAIMTDLSPETAYSVSVIIAGRNAGAPTE